MNDLFLFDRDHRLQYGSIAGVDEAGRGPLAGPLVAAAVVFPGDFSHPMLNDSKKLTDKKRRELFPIVLDNAVAWSTGTVTPGEIDRNRMAWAVRTSFKRAMEPLAGDADLFLVDGNGVPGLGHPCLFVVRGDSKSLSIAAASILAKVTRDDMMVKAADAYPGYGFDRHKGYGTGDHLKALERLGPTPLHRMSFEPLRSMYSTGQLSLFPSAGKKPGRAAESRVAEHLRAEGYEILERNWVCAAGEIDIIASKDDAVFFIEVKSTFSGREDLALGKMNGAKASRISRAASVWIGDNGYKGDTGLLFILYSPGGMEVFRMS